MREPSEPGTIVLLSNGETLLLVKSSGPWGWWNMTRKWWQEWAAVSDLAPSIVHHGYIPPTPPTPEPTLPHAVVRDAEGDVMFGTREGWHLPNVGTISWSEVVQPVEILFPGVPDA